MSKNIITGIILFLITFKTFSQNNSQDTLSEKLVFYVGEQVINADDENEKLIIQLWKDYLLNGEYGDTNSPYWSLENVNVPDEYLWAVGINNIQNRKLHI